MVWVFDSWVGEKILFIGINGLIELMVFQSYWRFAIISIVLKDMNLVCRSIPTKAQLADIGILIKLTPP